jgi:hypothetical protein
MSPQPAASLEYHGPGFRFRYPVDWGVEEDQPGEEFTVTVRPRGETTAFWSVTMLRDRPPPQLTLRTILRAFEEEYAELDSYPVEERIAGQEAVGRDLEFFCLELTNSAFVRVLRTRAFTLVILAQATDAELEECRESFALMSGSLECGSLGPDLPS